MSQGPTQTDAQKHFEQTTADTLDTEDAKRATKGTQKVSELLVKTLKI